MVKKLWIPEHDRVTRRCSHADLWVTHGFQGSVDPKKVSLHHNQHPAATRTRCIDGHQCATYVWTRTARPECAAWGAASGYPGGLSCSPPNTPQLGLVSVSCLLDPSSSRCFAVAFFSPSFDPGEKLRTVERGKTARVQPECCGLSFLSFLKRTTLRSEAARWKKVSVALRSLNIAARPQETAKSVYRVLFAVYSLLNASCSLIRHKFILFKPLLSHSSHTASQSTPLLSVLSLLLHFFSRPFPLQWWVGESGPFTFPESLSYSLRLRSLLCSFSQWDTESLRESFQLLKCLLHFLLLCLNVWDKVWHSPFSLKKRCTLFGFFFFFSELTHR